MAFRLCISLLRRRLVRRLLLVCASLLLALVVASATVAYHYHMSLPEAARGLCKIAALVAIRVGVGLYDPCSPRLADLGAGNEERASADGIARVEDFFQHRRDRAVPSGQRLQVVKLENSTICRSPFAFSYQPYDEPRLHELCKKYRLDQVVAGSSGEFEQMVRLRSWTRSRFRRRDYQPKMSDFDALEILDRDHHNLADAPLDRATQYDPCHFFPLFYAQILVSVGHTARLVSMGHGSAEVWSNQYKKWINMDVELDWHYEKAGIPLNAMELRDEHFEERPTSVRIVRGNQSSGDANTTMVHLKVESVPVEAMIKHYLDEFNIVEMRNDWMTNHYFPGHPRCSLYSTLRYEDTRLDNDAGSRNLDRLIVPSTKKREELYWTLNQAEIWVCESSTDERLDLLFKTVTPNFDCFEIRIDEREPIRSPSAIFAWQLHEGENLLSVLPVNKFGIRGIPSNIHLLLAAHDGDGKHSPGD